MAGGAVGVGHPQRLGGRGVAVETEDEQAAGRGPPDRLVVQPDVGPGRGPPEGEAALAIDAAQPQRRRRGQRASGVTGGGNAQQDRPPVQELRSFQRFSASAGPA